MPMARCGMSDIRGGENLIRGEQHYKKETPPDAGVAIARFIYTPLTWELEPMQKKKKTCSVGGG